jgi:hypothetical protein
VIGFLPKSWVQTGPVLKRLDNLFSSGNEICSNIAGCEMKVDQILLAVTAIISGRGFDVRSICPYVHQKGMSALYIHRDVEATLDPDAIG